MADGQDRLKLYTRILSYLRPHLFVFLAAVGATFVFAALDASAFVLLIPFVEALFSGRSNEGAASLDAAVNDPDLMTRLLDGTVYRFVDVQGDPLEAIQGIIVLILALFVLKNVFDFGRTYLVARVEQAVTRDLRNEVYDHVLDLDLAFFGRTRVGQITSRMTHDVEKLRTLITKEMAKILSSVFEFLVAVGFMVILSWKLTLAAFVVLPGTMGIWGPLVKRLRRGDRRVLNLAGEVNAHIQETLSGIRLVKSAGAENMEQVRFRALTGMYYSTFLRTERLRALAGPMTETLATVGTVVILWYGARLVVVDGALTGAQFVGFLALSLKLFAPVKYAAKFPALVQPGLVGAERIFEVIDSEVIALITAAKEQADFVPPIQPTPEEDNSVNQQLGDADTESAEQLSEEDLEAYEQIFSDASYWRQLGEEYQNPLIVTGTIHFAPYERAGMVSREREVYDSIGRRRVVPTRTYQERRGYVLSPKFIFIDGGTGATLYTERHREEILYDARQNTPALSSYFELMDRLLPSFLGTLSNESIRGTRILLR